METDNVTEEYGCSHVENSALDDESCKRYITLDRLICMMFS